MAQDKKIINQAFISKVGKKVGDKDVNYRYGAQDLTLMEVKKGVVVVNHLQELREAKNWENVLNQVHEAQLLQEKNSLQKLWDSIRFLKKQKMIKLTPELEEPEELDKSKEQQIIEAKQTIKETLESLYLMNTVVAVNQEEVNKFIIANSYLGDNAYMLKITPNPDGDFNLGVGGKFPNPPLIEKNSLTLDLDSQPPRKSGIELTKEVLEQSRDNETTTFGTAALTLVLLL